MSAPKLTEAQREPGAIGAVKYYLGHPDTRWHVHPNPEPDQILAHDWYGTWALTPNGQWFKMPVGCVFTREITREEADAGRAALRGDK